MGRGATRAKVKRRHGTTSCAVPGCQLLALKRLDGAWLCGPHAHQAAHGLLMERLEQETDRMLMEANARAYGHEPQRGKPVLLSR